MTSLENDSPDYLDIDFDNNLNRENIPKNYASNYVEISKRIKNIPPTRYYGSKRRLLFWLYHNLKNVQFNSVLDGFGGTASVSLLFKAMGKKVTYNDVFLFNTLSALSLLPNSNSHKIQEYNTGKLLSSVKPIKGFISDNFEGLYYTPEENYWLDGIMDVIGNLSDPIQKAICCYCLFQSCLKKRPFNLFHRANLNLRLNRNVKRSFGNQTTWDTQFPELFTRSFKDLNKSLWDSGVEQVVLDPGDVFEIDSGFDLVYLDPPYVNNYDYSDDYLVKYHFLEGLSNYPEWSNLIDY